MRYLVVALMVMGSGFQHVLAADLSAMLDEVHSSRKPVGFEQIDVSDVVARYFPLNTRKAVIAQAFTLSETSKIIEDTPDTLVVRDNRGQAILEPDASSVVMTFMFNKDSLLGRVYAVRLKSQ
ncbi:hypothetical protein K5D34_12290 [Pseudomonas cichorii]|uniref:DUF6393 family protein n=1 Tax=Pseudomonas cichorii TaxID=36746 RepID=UPI0019109138|nr:DUF6393 family protein [Pseudomonas cichorii]MBX8510457.1 hypothetical protein [Pseudomonas cichorii]MBX8518755.1 hypothetical protein [Pseudomonas cichorii]MBX8523874.1 hypothetical protein [Pseudomonas cichorii]MBX8547863.1 hypothetical protein [Pseudomonas cichorii]MBX8548017.1 hypothetical protein [Pseudomonas cichorii]